MEGTARAKVGRRTLLVAAAAGAAATAMRSVTAPADVVAADHDALKIGETNTGATETLLRAPTSHGLSVASDGGDGLRVSTSVEVKSGVYGLSTAQGGYGVFGRSVPGGATGYLGGNGIGVLGSSSTPGGAGVWGEQAHQSGAAVYAKNTPGKSVAYLGFGTDAILASAPTDLDHLALKVLGRVWFERMAKVVISAGKSSVRLNGIEGLGDNSMVFATLQTNRAGIYVQAAVSNPAAKTVSIYLNKAVPAATNVAFFILG